MEVLQVQSELDEMADLYDQLAPSRVLEVGVWQGGTLREWLTLGNPDLLVAVDLTHPNEDEYRLWRYLRIDLHVIHGNSWDEHVKAQVREHAPYDWAFIDADHGPVGVRNDTDLVLPLMRPGGILAFHDIVAGSGYQGEYAPATVVNELERAGYTVDRIIDAAPHPEAHGIAIVHIPKGEH
jgi:predicted O-methyltransferase YrrM